MLRGNTSSPGAASINAGSLKEESEPPSKETIQNFQKKSPTW